MRKNKLIASDESRVTAAQHERPCSDCPFRRDSIPGWLGGNAPEDFVSAAHADNIMMCHVIRNQQCAGAAIYRANVCKLSRIAGVLALPPDVSTVFKTRQEFINHHNDS